MLDGIDGGNKNKKITSGWGEVGAKPTIGGGFGNSAQKSKNKFGADDIDSLLDDMEHKKGEDTRPKTAAPKHHKTFSLPADDNLDDLDDFE